MSDTVEPLVLGKIGAPYGVKGWVKITSYTEEMAGIFDYAPWQLVQGKQNKEITVDQWRVHNKGLIAKLVGVDGRDDAEAIKNLEIVVSPEQLPELEGDEFYWKDLIGMQVVTEQGYNLGTVKDLFETGANDVLVVKANTNDAFGQKERMVPYIPEQVILNVSTEENLIKVDWDPAF